MENNDKELKVISQKLEKLTSIIQSYMAFDLSKKDVNQNNISKILHSSKTNVNDMLKGLKTKAKVKQIGQG